MYYVINTFQKSKPSFVYREDTYIDNHSLAYILHYFEALWHTNFRDETRPYDVEDKRHRYGDAQSQIELWIWEINESEYQTYKSQGVIEI